MGMFLDHFVFFTFIVLVAIIYLWDIAGTVKRQRDILGERDRTSPSRPMDRD